MLAVGEEIRPVIVKLMMLFGAHAPLHLGIAVQVITVQRYPRFLQQRRDAYCLRPWFTGASGDLASGQPLPAAYRCGRCYYKGREAISVPMSSVKPAKLMSKEGLDCSTAPSL